ncbi:MAG: sigma-70 family RNA polymerase sigma factor [Prevotella sp.]|nr:sigma-70 family RNA polymerase sigma factor [Prevotella sp.]
MTRSEFEHIAAPLRQKVLRVGLDFFGNREDAEDSAQEAMAQLWRYCEHIDTNRNVEALAVRVAKNCCVSIYRKRKRRAVTISIDPLIQQPADPASSPHDELEAEDERRLLDNAITLLNPRERQLFEMRQKEGLSTEEIAVQTGIPKSSVAAMVSAARKKIFQEIRKQWNQ